MEQANILAVETSGIIGSVALAHGPQLLGQQYFTARLRHASELLPTIDHLCRQYNITPRDINHVYISAGPGSFTGIRIAVTFAKVMAFAWPIKIVAVPSLESLALNITIPDITRANITPVNVSQTTISQPCNTFNDNNARLPADIRYLATILDAGRGQIFAAVFELTNGNNSDVGFLPGLNVLTPSMLTTTRDLLANTPRPLYIIGPGVRRYAEELIVADVQALDEKYSQPQARHVYTIGYRMACAGRFTSIDKLQPFYLRRPEAEEKWEKLHPSKQ